MALTLVPLFAVAAMRVCRTGVRGYQRSVHTLAVGPTVPLVATGVMNAQLLPEVTPGMDSHVPEVVYSSPDV